MPNVTPLASQVGLRFGTLFGDVSILVITRC